MTPLAHHHRSLGPKFVFFMFLALRQVIHLGFVRGVDLVAILLLLPQHPLGDLQPVARMTTNFNVTMENVSFALVAVIVTVLVPALVGVPLTIPVVVFNDNPAERASLVNAQAG